jgi:DNA-binding MarR family transcriptional regulator
MDQARARATEEMMNVSRTMTAIVARTLTDVADEITVPQLRVLALLNSRGPMNLSTIAQHLDVNPSNASRTCDQLVTTEKVVREAHDLDRRSSMLRLTADGDRFVADLMAARQRLIDAARGVGRSAGEPDHPMAAVTLPARQRAPHRRTGGNRGPTRQEDRAETLTVAVPAVGIRGWGGASRLWPRRPTLAAL